MSDASLKDWEAGHKLPRHLMATYLTNQGHPRNVDVDQKHMRLRFRTGLKLVHEWNAYPISGPLRDVAKFL